MAAEFSIIKKGKKYSTDYRVYVTKDKKVISPINDIPVWCPEDPTLINVVNEIPRFENGKFEINKEAEYNPIIQDIKKEKLRFVCNLYPFKGYLWNYGAIPQTWEDPNKKDHFVDANGDDDPLDVIEIGSRRKKMGEVYTAKVLGCFALLDEGECDWKIIVIDSKDEKAELINTVEDIRRHFNGLLEDTMKWFRYYKVADGKNENTFALEGKIMDKKYAMEVIKETHESWKKWDIRNKTVSNMIIEEGAKYEDEDTKEGAKYEEEPSSTGGFFYLG